MGLRDLSIIVIGGLNTDIVALGAKRLLQTGESTYADKLYIGPGGKAQNIARMIAVLKDKECVAIVSKTSKDPYGLWKLPVDSLKKAKVNTEYVSVVSFEKENKFPSVALIPVDAKGRNQIYVIPGITNDFLPKDIDKASELFGVVAANKGILVLTLEIPYKTALYAVRKANQLGIKVFLDPGGVEEGQDYRELINQKIFLLKPNEFEAQILTGTVVTDAESAKKAANQLLTYGIENVIITMGEKGGYLFNKHLEQHIPTPKVKAGSEKDETGAGDQTMAALVWAISQGKNIQDAAKSAILAGTLEFYKLGINPVTKEELNKYL